MKSKSVESDCKLARDRHAAFGVDTDRVSQTLARPRPLIRSLLLALVAPIDQLKAAQRAGYYTTRLALVEEGKSLPFGAVGDFFCLQQDVPAGKSWVAGVKRCEKKILSLR